MASSRGWLAFHRSLEKQGDLNEVSSYIRVKTLAVTQLHSAANTTLRESKTEGAQDLCSDTRSLRYCAPQRANPAVTLKFHWTLSCMPRSDPGECASTKMKEGLTSKIVWFNCCLIKTYQNYIKTLQSMALLLGKPDLCSAWYLFVYINR